MSLKNILLRFAAILTAFILGVGFFNVAQYLQSFFRTPEIGAAQSVIKPEAARVEPAARVALMAFDGAGIFAGSEENTEAEFDAGDDYYIIEDLPREFKDFERLSITTKDYENTSKENDYQGIPIPPQGYVLTEKQFKLVRINIANRQIAFETEAKKGISYRFAGQLIDEKGTIGVSTSYSVLEGRLVKMRDGKKVAEIEVNLGRVGGC